MSRHRRSSARTWAARQRSAQQAIRAELRAARDQERQLEKLAKLKQRQATAQEKEKIRLFHEAQETDVSERNQDLADTLGELTALLDDSISTRHPLDYETLKLPLLIPDFNPSGLDVPESAPRREDYLPKPLSFFQALVPGATKKREAALREARVCFDLDVAAHVQREQARKFTLAAALEKHDRAVREIKESTDRQHQEVDQLKAAYEAGDVDGCIQYFEAVLAAQTNPVGWAESFKVAYVHESKQLVIEYDLPTFDIVPEVSAYKYNKAKREISATRRPATERRRIYARLVSQATLAVINALFDADYCKHADSIVFNGHVDSIDKATGQRVHPCLITVRTTRDVFTKLDLSKVDPEACLKGLNASLSKSPDELTPVKPVLEFNMVDPRFVEEQDVLSGLDNRSNLMELNPREFESLITNLFEKMGLETRQTRPSRDGGVDCVAYDPRPIFGGKVVIQAKRYKNTVGVSAVRDLFGTVQNEGASKGILVTTSGFGKSSFEFADGKPLELLSGSHLLYLLAEHCGIQAKIEVPEGWKDPSVDLGE